MTNESITSPLLLALAASTATRYFDATIADIAAYTNAIAADSFADAIALDISDLIHNANIGEFIPDAILNSLSDDDIDAISDLFFNNATAIATLIAEEILSIRNN